MTDTTDPADAGETIRQLRAQVAQAEADKNGLRDQIRKLLTILDDWDKDRAEQHNGGLTMHTYGQTPDWFVEAAFWACYGFDPSDARAAMKGPMP